jgi:hypothetical protein
MLARRVQQTIDALESTAGWRINVVAVWAVQFDGFQAGEIGSSARNDMARVAKNSGTSAKMTSFVFLNL